MIRSNPFGVTILTGEDAKTFLQDINRDYKINIDLTKSDKLAKEVAEKGYGVIELDDK